MRGKLTGFMLCAVCGLALSMGLSGSAAAEAEQAVVPASKSAELEEALQIRRYEEGPVIGAGDYEFGGVPGAGFQLPMGVALASGMVYLICEGVANSGKKRR